MFHVVDDAAGTQLTLVMACVGDDSATRSHHDGDVCCRLLVVIQDARWHPNDGMCCMLLMVKEADTTTACVAVID